jgi:hypothetical protein
MSVRYHGTSVCQLCDQAWFVVARVGVVARANPLRWKAGKQHAVLGSN